MNLPGYTINCQCTLVLLFCVSFSLTLDLNLSSKNFYNLDSTIRATHHPANGTIRFNNEQLNKHAILHTALGLKGKSYPIYASTYSIDYKFQFLIREFENLICAYHLSRKSSNCTTDLNVPTIKAIRIAESVIMIVRSTPQSRSGTTTHSLIQFVESLETFKPLKFYQDLKLMIPPHFNLIVQSIEQLGGFQFILFDRVSFLKSLIILFINGTSQNNYPQKPESIAYSLPFATKGGQFLQFNGIKYLYVYTHEKESEIIRFKLQDLDKLFRKSWQACREEKLGVEKGIKLIDFQSFVLDPQNLRPCDGRSQIPMIMDYTFNDKAINEGIVNAHGLIWLFFGAKIRQKFFFTWHNDRVYRCSDSQLIECDYVWSDEKSDDDEYPLFNSYRIDRIEGKLEVTSFKLEKGQSSEDRKTFVSMHEMIDYKLIDWNKISCSHTKSKFIYLIVPYLMSVCPVNFMVNQLVVCGFMTILRIIRVANSGWKVIVILVVHVLAIISREKQYKLIRLLLHLILIFLK